MLMPSLLNPMAQMLERSRVSTFVENAKAAVAQSDKIDSMLKAGAVKARFQHLAELDDAAPMLFGDKDRRVKAMDSRILESLISGNVNLFTVGLRNGGAIASIT